MSHPAERFIKYGICRFRGVDDLDMLYARMQVLLRNKGIYAITKDEFLSLEASMEFPVPFLITRRDHRPSAQFLKKHGIFELEFPTEESLKASNLLDIGLLRQHAEIALLGRVPHREIARRLNTQHSTKLTEKTVSEYERLFFNVPMVSFDEWTRYNSEHNASQANREAALLHGPNMAMHRLGFQTAIESKQIMQTAQQNLYFRLLELRQMSLTPDTVRMENSTVRTLLAVDVRLKESDLALKEVLENFKKFRQDKKRKPVGSIEDIASRGTYSGLIEAPVHERANGELT